MISASSSGDMSRKFFRKKLVWVNSEQPRRPRPRRSPPPRRGSSDATSARSRDVLIGCSPASWEERAAPAAWNWGWCELWQCTQRRYCLSPFQLPVRRPCTPARQSRYLVPWHCPQSRYDSSKGTSVPLARRRWSRSSAAWQSRHQRCSSSWMQDDLFVHVLEHTPLRVGRHVLAVALGAGEEVRVLEGRGRRLEDHRVDRGRPANASGFLRSVGALPVRSDCMNRQYGENQKPSAEASMNSMALHASSPPSSFPCLVFISGR